MTGINSYHTITPPLTKATQLQGEIVLKLLESTKVPSPSQGNINNSSNNKGRILDISI